MFEFIRGYHFPHTARQCRAVFYHNLSPDPMDQTISTELIKHQDRLFAENYGVQLNTVYIDQAYNAQAERSSFEAMLADARAGNFDMIITKSIDQFAPTSEETIQIIEELLSLPNPVTVIFESDMLDSYVIHSVVPILRGCCT